MKQEADRFLAPVPSPAGSVESLGDGWKVKKWKTPSSHGFARPVGAGPEHAPGQAAVRHSLLQRRRWCHPLGILGGVGAAALAVIMMANVMPPEAGSSDMSQPVKAATLSSSMPTEVQKAEPEPSLIPRRPASLQTALAPQEMSAPQDSLANDEYQLYLGAYPSEVGARLLWTGLKANPRTTLDGLDPIFERTENELGTFYHVFAGTLSNHDDADRYCERLKQQNVSCTIFTLGG